MKQTLILFTSMLLFNMSVMADNGLVRIASQFDVVTTSERLVNVLKNNGMTVFTTINHSAGATRVGMVLPDTRVVIFGNPKIGTPLMNCSASYAIDLPQKALIQVDDSGLVWLTYNDPAWLAKRHGDEGCEAVTSKVKKALGSFAAAATQVE